MLQETKPSWRQRRGSAIPLTETEQRELYQPLRQLLETDEAAWRKEREAREKAQVEKTQ